MTLEARNTRQHVTDKTLKRYGGARERSEKRDQRDTIAPARKKRKPIGAVVHERVKFSGRLDKQFGAD